MKEHAIIESQQAPLSIPARLAEAAQRIDSLALQAGGVFGKSGSFAEEITVALAVQSIRDSLTHEVMLPVMALMNTDIGFKTDRDPKQINPKTGQANTPYPLEVVKDCFIESRLRGFHVCGNEWNIIAGRFYGCKAGFRRKLTDGKTFPGLSNFSDTYEVPRLVPDASGNPRGAIVKCRATWKLKGEQCSIEREFPIKVNSMMGSDAILGKAQRKLCAAVHDILCGIPTPESEAGDEPAPIEVETVRAATVQERFGKAAEPVNASPAPEPAPEPPAAHEAPGQPSAAPANGPTENRASVIIADFLKADGVQFDDYKGWLKTTGRMSEAAVARMEGWNDTPETIATQIIRENAHVKCARLYGTA